MATCSKSLRVSPMCKFLHSKPEACLTVEILDDDKTVILLANNNNDFFHVGLSPISLQVRGGVQKVPILNEPVSDSEWQRLFSMHRIELALEDSAIATQLRADPSMAMSANNITSVHGQYKGSSKQKYLAVAFPHNTHLTTLKQISIDNITMVVKIHGMKQSTCTQRVSTVLKELGVAYEVVPVNFATGEHKSEEYIKTKQPFGQIPVLEDEDGFKLFESRAIARYLAEKYGNGKLLPKDLKAKAQFEQAASIEQAQFDPYASGLSVEKVFKPMRGVQTDEKLAASLQETLEAKLKGYEIILSKQKYLAGDEVTLADLFHLPYGWMVTEKLGVQALKSDSLPNVKRWWADITSRDSWKAVQAELAQ